MIKTIPKNKAQVEALKMIRTSKLENRDVTENDVKKLTGDIRRLGVKKGATIVMLHKYFKEIDSDPFAVRERVRNMMEALKEFKEDEIPNPKVEERILTKFWEYKEIRNGKTINVTSSGIINILSELGYYKIGEKNYVKKVGKIVHPATRVSIQDELKTYLYDLPSSMFEEFASADKVWDCIVEKRNLFDDKNLFSLDTLKGEFNKDKRDEINFFLEGCYIRVTADDIEFKDYESLDGMVWSESLMKKPFTRLDDRMSDYETLLFNTQNEDVTRFERAKKVLGYMMHRYNSPSDMKFTYLTEEKLSKESNGGSGKNVLLELLKYTRSLLRIDAGERINLKDKFLYQELEPYHDIILFNDVQKSFNPKLILNDITEGIKYEKKNKTSVTLDRGNTPKICGTGNSWLNISDGSVRRRLLDVKMSDYYNDSFSVADDFGKNLFDDFDGQEWNMTFTFALRCCQLYLKEGLPKATFDECEMLPFLTSSDFVLFMDKRIVGAEKILRSSLCKAFEEEYGEKVNATRFKEWTEMYFKAKRIMTKKSRETKGEEYAVKTGGEYFYEIE